MDSTKCWNCPAKIKTVTNLFSHPLLRVAICSTCFDYYNEPNWTVDEEGKSNFCNCCADGGTILPCDNENCSKAFCFPCLQKFYSRDEYNKLLEMCNNDSEVEDQENWMCLLCEKPELLKQAMEEFVEAKVKLKKADKSRRRSRRNKNASESSSATETTEDNENDESENGFKLSDEDEQVSKKRRSREIKKPSKKQKLSTTLNGHTNGHQSSPSTQSSEHINDEHSEHELNNQEPPQEPSIDPPAPNTVNNNISDKSLPSPASPDLSNVNSSKTNKLTTTTNPEKEPHNTTSSDYEYLSSNESPDASFIQDIDTLPEKYQIYIRKEIERNKRLKIINKKNKIKKEEHRKMKKETLIEKGVQKLELKEEIGLV